MSENTTAKMIRVPADLWRNAKAKAALEGVSLGAILVRLLTAYVKGGK